MQSRWGTHNNYYYTYSSSVNNLRSLSPLVFAVLFFAVTLYFSITDLANEKPRMVIHIPLKISSFSDSSHGPTEALYVLLPWLLKTIETFVCDVAKSTSVYCIYPFTGLGFVFGIIIRNSTFLSLSFNFFKTYPPIYLIAFSSSYVYSTTLDSDDSDNSPSTSLNVLVSICSNSLKVRCW